METYEVSFFILNLKSFFPSILSGVLLAISFPSVGWGLLSFVALVPLLTSIIDRSFIAGFMRGYVFGLVFGGINLFWLFRFVDRWTDSVILGLLPWLLVTIIFAIYFGLFGGCAARAVARGWWWSVPILWAGVEVIRSTIPAIYFPWGLIGYSLYKAPFLLQAASFGSVYFVSAWIVSFNVVITLMLRDSGKPIEQRLPGRVVWRYVFVPIAILLVSLGMYQRPQKGETQTLAAIQPGVDLAFQDEAAMQRQLARNVPIALERIAARKVDLAVLPEGIIEYNIDGEMVSPFTLDFNMSTIVGGQRTTERGSYQSSFLFTRSGLQDYSDKTRLVIFGEYVPFRDSLSFLSVFQIPDGDLIAAESTKVLQVESMKVGPIVCFEILFEEVARAQAEMGAEVFSVVSNDDWYQNTSAIDMLMSAAVLRAVENQIPLVKSASIGPSFIIDQKGNIVAQTVPGEVSVAVSDVLTASHPVSFFRVVFAAFCATMVVVFILPWHLRQKSKNP